MSLALAQTGGIQSPLIPALNDFRLNKAFLWQSFIQNNLFGSSFLKKSSVQFTCTVNIYVWSQSDMSITLSSSLSYHLSLSLSFSHFLSLTQNCTMDMVLHGHGMPRCPMKRRCGYSKSLHRLKIYTYSKLRIRLHQE